MHIKSLLEQLAAMAPREGFISFDTVLQMIERIFGVSRQHVHARLAMLQRRHVNLVRAVRNTFGVDVVANERDEWVFSRESKVVRDEVAARNNAILEDLDVLTGHLKMAQVLHPMLLLDGLESQQVRELAALIAQRVPTIKPNTSYTHGVYKQATREDAEDAEEAEKIKGSLFHNPPSELFVQRMKGEPDKFGVDLAEVRYVRDDIAREMAVEAVRLFLMDDVRPLRGKGTGTKYVEIMVNGTMLRYIRCADLLELGIDFEKNGNSNAAAELFKLLGMPSIPRS